MKNHFPAQRTSGLGSVGPLGRKRQPRSEDQGSAHRVKAQDRWRPAYGPETHCTMCLEGTPPDAGPAGRCTWRKRACASWRLGPPSSQVNAYACLPWGSEAPARAPVHSIGPWPSAFTHLPLATGYCRLAVCHQSFAIGLWPSAPDAHRLPSPLAPRPRYTCEYSAGTSERLVMPQRMDLSAYSGIWLSRFQSGCAPNRPHAAFCSSMLLNPSM